MNTANVSRNSFSESRRFGSFSTWVVVAISGLLPILIWITRSRLGSVFAEYDVQLSALSVAFLNPLATLLGAVPLALVIAKELGLSDPVLRQRCDTWIGVLAAVIYAVGSYALLSPVFPLINQLAPG